MSQEIIQPVEVDVVIISYAKTEELLKETRLCLSSLCESENSKSVRFRIIVVESNKEVTHDSIITLGHDIRTVYTDKEFGYHTYLNVGLEHGNAEWSCLCNNDLVFKKNWASQILSLIFAQRKNDVGGLWDYVSASPANPNESWHYSKLGKLEVGYEVRKHIAGWCLFQSRNVFEKIGKLDERVKFWFCDNWYSVALQYNKIPHIFVGNSIVEHHSNTEGTTTNDVGLSEEEKHAMTYGAGDEFRAIIREMMNDKNWGRTSDEEKSAIEKKTGRKYY